jgi:hypothetical protein
VAEREFESEQTMTRQEARAYVKQWLLTGRLLEELRWRELAALDDARALRASDALIESAERVPLPPGRREWSGLVDQQALFRRLSRA